jgi:transcription initiation factor TFIID subunit 5
LTTLLWPLFVYALLKLANDYYSKDAEIFFRAYSPQFTQQHPDEVRQLSTITQPTHIQASELAKRYLNNRYRIRMTKTAQSILYQWLEANEDKGTAKITTILNVQCQIIPIERAQLGNERGLAAMLARGSNQGYELPAEDEGIPGHNAGSANTNLNAPSALPKLQLGSLPKDVDMMEDLRDELEELDKQDPPLPGLPTLVEELDRQIKREPTEDAPSRDVVPLPPPLAKDVAMEVQKIRELRDRFRIDPRTGGVGPGMSIIMYTFHNTEDSINCIDFSGDKKMVAAGTREAYIRVWSLDGGPLPMRPDAPSDEIPQASRRLFGHGGAIYNVAFSPSTEKPPISYNVDTKPSYLLSCSVDKTIRLWSMETYACVVIYKGHTDPIWDVRWCPHGHYFLSAGNDKTARLWTTEQIAAVRLFVGHDSAVEQCAWHPNGVYVFTAGQDRTIRMWDIASGRSIRMFTSHQGSITALQCAPDGKTLASADDQGVIILWDLESGRRIKHMRGHKNGGIWSLTWSMESTVLVSGASDCTVRVWDVELKSGAHGKAADGSGVKGDGVTGSATTSATTTAGVAGVGTQKKKKGESAATPDQISAFPTKRTPVYKVMFTHNNLVLSAGAYLPQRN